MDGNGLCVRMCFSWSFKFKLTWRKGQCWTCDLTRAAIYSSSVSLCLQTNFKFTFKELLQHSLWVFYHQNNIKFSRSFIVRKLSVSSDDLEIWRLRPNKIWRFQVLFTITISFIKYFFSIPFFASFSINSSFPSSCLFYSQFHSIHKIFTILNIKFNNLGNL